VGAWIGIGGGGVAAIVLIVVAIVMMGGSNSKKEGDTQVADADQPVTTPVEDGKSSDTKSGSGSKKPSFKFPGQKKFAPGAGSSSKKSATRPLGSSNPSKTSKSSTPKTQNNGGSSSNSSTAKKNVTPPKLGADFSEALKRAKNRLAQAEKRQKQRAKGSKAAGADDKGPSLAAGPTLAVWKAKVDPSKETVEFATGKISINLEKHQSIHFPVNPSRFVLVIYRDGKDHLWTVYDLQTAKGKTTAKDAVGRPVTGQDMPNLRLPTLSPNGKFMVSKVRDPDTKEYVFRVWSFETGIMLQDIPVGKKSRSDQAYFAGGDSLVTTDSPDYYSVQLSVTNLADGKKSKPFTIKGSSKKRFLNKSIAVSHGGKYVALVMGQKLVIHELASGANAGEAPIPEMVRECYGIAFSNNGEKLAALFRGESAGYLLIWDFRNGEVLVERPYDDRLPHYSYEGPQLAWMPDDSGVIFRGHIMADVQTGLEVWNFPKTTRDSRKIIKRGDKMDMLVVLRQKQVKNLTTTVLPTADIASTIQTVRATGSLLDASLPPSTTPNLISARQVSMPSGNVDWSVVPDDPGAPLGITERDIVGINEGSSPKRLMISPPHSAKAIVYSQPPHKSRSGRKTMKMLHLQSRYCQVLCSGNSR